MKKRHAIIIAISVMIILIAGIFLLVNANKKPYKDLDASQIRAATVRLTPPDKTIQIIEPNELVEYLNDIVIYNKDNSYTENDGQGVTFTLTMSDKSIQLKEDLIKHNLKDIVRGNAEKALNVLPRKTMKWLKP